MEVYMTNIDQSYSKFDVIRELAEIFHGPDYEDLQHEPINFDVFLYRGKNCDRPHLGSGSLTLPTIEIAEQFLSEYGQREYGQTPFKNCWVGERKIKFVKSRYEPRPDILEKINRIPYKDPSAAEDEEERRQIAENGIVDLSKIQFGWLTHEGVFSIEWEHSCLFSGVLTFSLDPAEILITAATNLAFSVFAVIRIRLTSIQAVSLHFHDSLHSHNSLRFHDSRQPIIYVTLYNPPSFEIKTGEGDLNRRVSHLPLPGHEIVAPYTSETLRLVCTSEYDLALFQSLYHNSQSPQRKGVIHSWDQAIDRCKIFTPSAIARVESFVCQLEWNVAFQVESLVRWLLLDVREMISLIPEIQAFIRLKGSEYTAAMLREFAVKMRHRRVQPLSNEKRDTIEQCFTSAAKSHARRTTEKLNDDQAEMCPAPESMSERNLFTSYHVTITPTSYYLEGPFTERSNSVIRRFDSSKHECFLKVRFADEGLVKYRQGYDRNIDGELYIRSRLGKFLSRDGFLLIAGRKFYFLAYTQSSLKDHTVWFLKPFDSDSGRVDCASIINSIGNFSAPLRRCPALYGARISQAFTSTEASTVEVEETLFMEDLKTADGEYNFTDGVGTMSKEFARQVWTELRDTRRHMRDLVDDNLPSFQIRTGGYKGMLSIDHKLKGNVICVRPSMAKFRSIDTQRIEVVQLFDKPFKLSLNRPLIVILESLGVKYKAFETLLDRALEKTFRSTESLDTAARLLDTFGLGNSFRMTSIWLELSRLGVDKIIQAESFHQSMLKYAVHHILRDLKNHTRIPVEGAWSLVGVADIHQYLKEGEVFAAVKIADGPVQYLSGNVLITRSPVSHPGDVQMARAIGKPPPGSCFQYEPLINTVVFSTQGSRPLPSMLGGGDLDGDTYNIIPLDLHPDLQPKTFFEPAQYARPVRKYLDQECTMDDVADFVMEYINSDIIGLIATRWLIIADQNRNGVFHKDCLKLSQLHSDAVDYPKTGQPVDPTEVPRFHFSQRPDWNAFETVSPDSSQYYKSHRALGRLFRRITLPDVESAVLISPPSTKSKAPQVIPDLNMLVQEDDSYRLLQQRLLLFGINIGQPITDIVQIYENYILKFEDISTSCSLSSKTILTEQEVLLGIIAAKTSNLKNRGARMAKMREETQFLVKITRSKITGILNAEDEYDLKDICNRAWSAWVFSRNPGAVKVGARSFQYICLGLLLSSLKDLEDADDEARTGLKRKHSDEGELDHKRTRYTTKIS